MARKKISEFTAKTLLFRYLGLPYSGTPVILASEARPGSVLVDKGTDSGQARMTNSYLSKLDKNRLFVVKVDEGVKGRMKKGLVKLNMKAEEIEHTIQEISQTGYRQFLIEEFLPHDSLQEKYFSIERTREGKVIYYSDKGGIDIEQNQESVLRTILIGEDEQIQNKVTQFLQLDKEIFKKILEFFDEQYISFLEVNPFIIHDSRFIILDLAVEVDSAAEFFVTHGWSSKDFVGDELLGEKTLEEKNILELKAKSQAAFKLDMLNPNGSIWMLLSGGGASIVLADEAYNQGHGQNLANYGEYSGNPNQEETYIYTKNLLSLLLKSQSSKKILIIGGGVANFTDIRATFKGVIRALDDVKDQLVQQGVKVFVRRGGPHQDEGLSAMREFLDKAEILGGVWDQSLVLSDVITKAIDYLQGQ